MSKPLFRTFEIRHTLRFVVPSTVFDDAEAEATRTVVQAFSRGMGPAFDIMRDELKCALLGPALAVEEITDAR